MKSKRIKRIFSHLRHKRLRKYRLPIFRHSKDFQIGFYVGEIIYEKYLPCTDADMLQTNHIIPLLPEDLIEYKRLDKEWSDYSWNNFGDKKDKDPVIKAEKLRLFNISRNFWYVAAKKVLPSVLKCDILPLPRRLDVDEFKKGLRYFLWDCDRWSYSLEFDDIIISEEHGIQFISLKLDTYSNQ
jgi:hypothetical protein